MEFSAFLQTVLKTRRFGLTPDEVKEIQSEAKDTPEETIAYFNSNQPEKSPKWKKFIAVVEHVHLRQKLDITLQNRDDTKRLCEQFLKEFDDEFEQKIEIEDLKAALALVGVDKTEDRANTISRLKQRQADAEEQQRRAQTEQQRKEQTERERRAEAERQRKDAEERRRKADADAARQRKEAEENQRKKEADRVRGPVDLEQLESALRGTPAFEKLAQDEWTFIERHLTEECETYQRKVENDKFVESIKEALKEKNAGTEAACEEWAKRLGALEQDVAERREEQQRSERFDNITELKLLLNTHAEITASDLLHDIVESRKSQKRRSKIADDLRKLKIASNAEIREWSKLIAKHVPPEARDPGPLPDKLRSLQIQLRGQLAKLKKLQQPEKPQDDAGNESNGESKVKGYLVHNGEVEVGTVCKEIEEDKDFENFKDKPGSKATPFVFVDGSAAGGDGNLVESVEQWCYENDEIPFLSRKSDHERLEKWVSLLGLLSECRQAHEEAFQRVTEIEQLDHFLAAQMAICDVLIQESEDDPESKLPKLLAEYRSHLETEIDCYSEQAIHARHQCVQAELEQFRKDCEWREQEQEPFFIEVFRSDEMSGSESPPPQHVVSEGEEVWWAKYSARGLSNNLFKLRKGNPGTVRTSTTDPPCGSSDAHNPGGQSADHKYENFKKPTHFWNEHLFANIIEPDIRRIATELSLENGIPDIIVDACFPNNPTSSPRPVVSTSTGILLKNNIDGTDLSAREKDHSDESDPPNQQRPVEKRSIPKSANWENFTGKTFFFLFPAIIMRGLSMPAKVASGLFVLFAPFMIFGIQNPFKSGAKNVGSGVEWQAGPTLLSFLTLLFLLVVGVWAGKLAASLWRWKWAVPETTPRERIARGTVTSVLAPILAVLFVLYMMNPNLADSTSILNTKRAEILSNAHELRMWNMPAAAWLPLETEDATNNPKLELYKPQLRQAILNVLEDEFSSTFEEMGRTSKRLLAEFEESREKSTQADTAATQAEMAATQAEMAAARRENNSNLVVQAEARRLRAEAMGLRKEAKRLTSITTLAEQLANEKTPNDSLYATDLNENSQIKRILGTLNSSRNIGGYTLPNDFATLRSTNRLREFANRYYRHNESPTAENPAPKFDESFLPNTDTPTLLAMARDIIRLRKGATKDELATAPFAMISSLWPYEVADSLRPTKPTTSPSFVFSVFNPVDAIVIAILAVPAALAVILLWVLRKSEDQSAQRVRVASRWGLSLIVLILFGALIGRKASNDLLNTALSNDLVLAQQWVEDGFHDRNGDVLGVELEPWKRPTPAGYGWWDKIANWLSLGALTETLQLAGKETSNLRLTGMPLSRVPSEVPLAWLGLFVVGVVTYFIAWRGHEAERKRQLNDANRVIKNSLMKEWEGELNRLHDQWCADFRTSLTIWIDRQCQMLEFECQQELNQVVAERRKSHEFLSDKAIALKRQQAELKKESDIVSDIHKTCQSIRNTAHQALQSGR